MFSKTSIDQTSLLNDLLSNVVQSNHHWAIERTFEKLTTDCLITMISKNRTQNVFVTLWIDSKTGLQILRDLNLQQTWSSSQSHLSFWSWSRQKHDLFRSRWCFCVLNNCLIVLNHKSLYECLCMLFIYRNSSHETNDLIDISLLLEVSCSHAWFEYLIISIIYL